MHFTYTDIDRQELKQGDLLKRTPQVDEILQQVHPHYLKSDYSYFIVLTQTCDLVLRQGGKCSARYITIAAVRPFEKLLKREVSQYQDPLEVKSFICDRKHRKTLSQFLQKLFNNNESDYFYLHENLEQGIEKRYCAFLHLSIALKSREHYKVLLDAKVGELKETFQHKLGWHVGNIYSRIGTEDWAPNTLSAADFNKMIDDVLDESFIWVDSALKAQLKKQIREEDRTEFDIEYIDGLHKKVQSENLPKIDQLKKRLREVMSSAAIDSGKIDKTLDRLTNDIQISRILAPIQET